MARKTSPLVINAEDKTRLLEIIKKGADWRERDRANTILYLAEGLSVKEVAAAQGLFEETIRVRRRKWRQRGWDSLVDSKRCGAPTKLNDEHRDHLRSWVEAEPLTARQLLTRLKARFGVRIHVNTLASELKRLGYVWKRTRYSLKKNAIQLPSNGPKPTSMG